MFYIISSMVSFHFITNFIVDTVLICVGDCYLSLELVSLGSHKRHWAKQSGSCLSCTMATWWLVSSLLTPASLVLWPRGGWCQVYWLLPLLYYGHMVAGVKSTDSCLSCTMATWWLVSSLLTPASLVLWPRGGWCQVYWLLPLLYYGHMVAGVKSTDSCLSCTMATWWLVSSLLTPASLVLWPRGGWCQVY